MHTPDSHCHSHVDVVVDVDPCSFLAISRAIGEDPESVASRGNSEVRQNAYRKDCLLRLW